ncbi:serine hydrolase domain-containing protein [Sphingomonas adhaesiva]|uniref:serine hydrolase domain-containing protein n=1 Tax=Sphingomonas adhaesiva TaxID=28212 RepID=UPI002FF6743C
MRGTRWMLAGAMLLAAGGSALAQQQAPVAAPTPPAPAASTGSMLPATQALFDGYVAQKRVPGIVGAFGVGDWPTAFVASGRIAYDASAPAAGPDSLWRVYSMTKPVTAMAAMILIEEGKIGLDDPLSKYFPAFAHMRVLTSPDTSLDSRPATKPITIRELLTHTAGLGYNINAKGPLLKEYERLGILPAQLNAPTEAQARAVRPTTLAEFANRVATVPLIAEPGTTWHYSIGLDVMGAVIEKASGMPFDRFVQTRLFDPLKMTSTFWQVPAAETARFATNYAVVNGQSLPIDPAATSPYLQKPSFPYGGAGLVSSARDYDRFLHMVQDGGILDGVRVLKPETIALATSNLLPAGVTFTGVTPGANTNAGYGAGGYVILADKPGVMAGTWGWDGAANTVAWANPTRRMRGVVMVNIFPPGSLPLRAELPRALMTDAMRMNGAAGALK